MSSGFSRCIIYLRKKVQNSKKKNKSTLKPPLNSYFSRHTCHQKNKQCYSTFVQTKWDVFYRIFELCKELKKKKRRNLELIKVQNHWNGKSPKEIVRFGSASFLKNDTIATNVMSSLNSSHIWIQNQFKKIKIYPPKSKTRTKRQYIKTWNIFYKTLQIWRR